MTGPQLMPIMVSFQFFLLALGLLLARLVGIAPINDCHWDISSICMGLVAGVSLAALAIRVSALPWLRDLERLLDQQVAPIFQGLPWQSLIAIAALAGASEEVLFRGSYSAGWPKAVVWEQLWPLWWHLCFLALCTP